MQVYWTNISKEFHIPILLNEYLAILVTLLMSMPIYNTSVNDLMNDIFSKTIIFVKINLKTKTELQVKDFNIYLYYEFQTH